MFSIFDNNFCGDYLPMKSQILDCILFLILAFACFWMHNKYWKRQDDDSKNDWICGVVYAVGMLILCLVTNYFLKD